MRLISQDGFIDVPYENTILTVCNDGRILSTVFSSEEDFVLAIYSTKEKALKVMEMVREEYTGKPFVVSMNHKLSDEEIKEIAKCNVVSTFDYSNYSRATSGNNNTIFQFPSDEDVTI